MFYEKAFFFSLEPFHIYTYIYDLILSLKKKNSKVLMYKDIEINLSLL